MAALYSPDAQAQSSGKIANDAADISQLWDDLMKAGIRDHKLHIIDAKDADSLAYEPEK